MRRAAARNALKVGLIGAIEAARGATIGQRPRSGTRAPLRVLIADDYHPIRALLQHLLTVAGMETAVAADGEQALALVQSWNPDVVLLDWLMPGGGLDLVRRVVDEPGFDGQVIMLSGLDDPRDRDAAMEAGAARYFTKPTDNDRLISAIGQVGARLAS
jgi:two-component system OmpR family response regulator